MATASLVPKIRRILPTLTLLLDGPTRPDEVTAAHCPYLHVQTIKSAQLVGGAVPS